MGGHWGQAEVEAVEFGLRLLLGHAAEPGTRPACNVCYFRRWRRDLMVIAAVGGLGQVRLYGGVKVEVQCLVPEVLLIVESRRGLEIATEDVGIGLG